MRKLKLGDGFLLDLRQGRDGRGGGRAYRRRPPANVVDLVRKCEFFLHSLVGEKARGRDRRFLRGREATGRGGVGEVGVK